MSYDIQTTCLPGTLYQQNPGDKKIRLISGYGLRPGKNSYHPDSHQGTEI
ncbi:hypothetical protein F320042A7_05250 [Blautia producta]